MVFLLSIKKVISTLHSNSNSVVLLLITITCVHIHKRSVVVAVIIICFQPHHHLFRWRLLSSLRRRQSHSLPRRQERSSPPQPLLRYVKHLHNIIKGRCKATHCQKTNSIRLRGLIEIYSASKNIYSWPPIVFFISNIMCLNLSHFRFWTRYWCWYYNFVTRVRFCFVKVVQSRVL